MKIGIFDSGVGGLIIMKAICKKIPEYDYVYIGDTKRVPYGGRSHETIYDFTCDALDYFFKKENCKIVILACNTASSRALRKIQKVYIPKYFPDRKVIGVLIPSTEECINSKKVGIIATKGTVNSNTFPLEINKLNPQIKIFQNPAPLLVPIIEEGDYEFALPILQKYLKPILNKKIDTLVLGCTHYPILKKEIKGIVGSKVRVISQDEIIPEKLKEYLSRHSEIEKKLTKSKKIKILFTDITPTVEKLSKKWFGGNIKTKLIKL